MLRRLSIPVIAGVLYVGLAATALRADTIMYANNATGGSPYIYQIDVTTGAVLQTYTNLSGNNGRGVVTVGDTIYYTTASDNNVYKESKAGVNEGIAFSVSGASGLATMAYDGTDFYIGDYSGTNNVYKFKQDGTPDGTIALSHCTSFCDGLEFFKMGGQGYLVSNEFDGGFGGPNSYDLYDLNGTFIRTLFTSTSSGSTGIAFDGTDFWTSNIFDGTVSEWTENGTFVKTVTLSGYGSNSPLVEDLSFDYSQVLPTPEPGTLVLMGTGFLGMFGFVRRKFLR
ncbi:MAG: PEP-CTERM sorting domain-containing protein [Candidatus Korobacteraceae bacterium]